LVQPTVAYAGSFPHPDYENAILKMAAVMQQRGGRVVVSGNLPPGCLAPERIADLPILLEPPLPSFDDLKRKLRESVDLLLVPLPFDPSVNVFVRTSFPSKLADYTSIGLPMLFFGPPESSMMDWAEHNSGAALQVTTNSAEAIDEAITVFVKDGGLRVQLAERALAVGEAYFSYSKARQVFEEALTAGHRTFSSLR